MEIASYLIGKASSITVIGSSELPYQNTLGREIGKVTMTVRKRGREGERALNDVLSLLLLSVVACSLNSAVPADAVREKREILHER